MNLQTRIVVALSAVGLMVFGVSSASATTLEIGGMAQNKEVKFAATLNGSAPLTDTFGTVLNTCLASTIEGNTEPAFTAGALKGPITTLAFANCAEEKVVVDAPGRFSIENIIGTTHGTLRSLNAKVTVPSPFGALTCTTAAAPGTDIGLLTGVAAGAATMDISAVLNCGPLTAKWTATYFVTNPLGLGVT